MRKKQNEMKNPRLQKFIYGFLVFFALGGIFIAIGSVLYTTYFAWDSQMEAQSYKIAFEKDGKLYETPGIEGSYLAFDDHGGNDAMLYLNSFNSLGVFIALSLDEGNFLKTENPFFAGKIVSLVADKYAKMETVYKSPKQSVQIFKFFDQDQKPLLTFNPEEPNEYVQKLRPTFPMFSKRKSTLGVKQNYINVTKFLRDKLNRQIKIRTDKENELLIFSFQNGT